MIRRRTVGMAFALVGLLLAFRYAFVRGTESALFAAARDGNVAAVDALLKRGVSANTIGAAYGPSRQCACEGPAPQSALMIASWRGHASVVRLLLAHGADTEWRAGEGDTSLLLAVRGGKKSAVEVLLAHGADPNARAGRALKYCAKLVPSPDDVAVARLLLEHGADPNVEVASETPVYRRAT